MRIASREAAGKVTVQSETMRAERVICEGGSLDPHVETEKVTQRTRRQRRLWPLAARVSGRIRDRRAERRPVVDIVGLSRGGYTFAETCSNCCLPVAGRRCMRPGRARVRRHDGQERVGPHRKGHRIMLETNGRTTRATGEGRQ